MTDPENGDYRPLSGSGAEDYGCQTFPRGVPAPENHTRLYKDYPRSFSRDAIDFSGNISADTVWSAETVRVVGDVTIEDGVTLTIDPGVRVEFVDYYSLVVDGTLFALGTPEALIRFTTDEPQSFSVDQSHNACWNGIWFDETPATNEPSHLAYCIIECSKATGGGNGLYPYGGGAISVTEFAQLTIENCIIHNNVADYGGALFLYRQANPRITGNLIVDNHALQNAGAIYCAYSYPKLVNNTIIRNTIHNENDPYIDSCAVLSFHAKAVFTNNIIRDNNPDVFYSHNQLWNNKDYYTHYNDIEDAAVGDNIDADPLFVPGPQGCYYLSQATAGQTQQSPCVDAGNPISPLFEGTTRSDEAVDTSIVDMGYHYSISGLPLVMGDFDLDGDVDLADFSNTQLCVTGPGPTSISPCCRICDFEPDTDVDIDDLAAFTAVLIGP